MRKKRKTLDEIKSEVLMIMSKRVGPFKRISQGRLYEEIYGEPTAASENDARLIREAIQKLRMEGVPIMVSFAAGSGGYHLAASDSEINDFCKKFERRALRTLKQISEIKKQSMTDTMAQLKIKFEEA